MRPISATPHTFAENNDHSKKTNPLPSRARARKLENTDAPRRNLFLVPPVSLFLSISLFRFLQASNRADDPPFLSARVPVRRRGLRLLFAPPETSRTSPFFPLATLVVFHPSTTNGELNILPEGEKLKRLRGAQRGEESPLDSERGILDRERSTSRKTRSPD